MTPEQWKEIDRVWNIYADGGGVSVGWLVEQIPKCLKEIDRLNASRQRLQQTRKADQNLFKTQLRFYQNIEEENRQARELLQDILNSIPPPTIEKAIRAFLDREKP